MEKDEANDRRWFFTFHSAAGGSLFTSFVCFVPFVADKFLRMRGDICVYLCQSVANWLFALRALREIGRWRAVLTPADRDCAGSP